jgi:hemerythrin superfamily protein
MDAIELLISDHRKVDGIFQQFEKGGNTQEFEQLFQQLKEELTAHSKIEEQIFYPAVRNNPDTESLVEESYREHAQVEQLLQQIPGMDNTSTEWGQKMTELMRDDQHHVQEEETQLFPRVREHFNEGQVQQLGQQLQQLKTELKGQMGAPATATESQLDNQPQLDSSTASGGQMSQSQLDNSAASGDQMNRSQMDNSTSSGQLGAMDATETNQPSSRDM